MSFNPLNLLLALLVPVLVACAMYQSRLKWMRGARFLTAALLAAAYWALMDVVYAFDGFQYLMMDYTRFSIVGWVSIPLYALFTIEQAGLQKKPLTVAALALLTPSALMCMYALAPDAFTPLFNSVTKRSHLFGVGLFIDATPLGAALLIYHALLALGAAVINFISAVKRNGLTGMNIVVCASLAATSCGLLFLAMGRTSTIAVTLPVALTGVFSLLLHPSVYQTPEFGDGQTTVDRLIANGQARRMMNGSDAATGRDPLTGLATRELFADLLQQELYRNERTRKAIGVMHIHIDNLDEAVAALDSRAGDLLVYEFAQRLRRHMRKTDIIATLGRDEFIVAMPQIHNPRNVMTGLITRLSDAMRAPYFISEQRVKLSFNIGTTIAPDDGNTVEELLQNASTALAYATADPSVPYRYFSEVMNTLTDERTHTAGELKRALEADAFFVLYQPQLEVSGAERTPYGLDAQLYLRHPTLGDKPFADYETVAEEFGLIHGIGEWYLREALKTLKELSGVIGCKTRLNLGVSLKQLYEQGFVPAMRSMAGEYGIAPERIMYNIPEDAMLSHSKALRANIAALRAEGAHICLDNFGIGQSSLLNVREFSIDALRLDKSVTNPVKDDAKSAALVHTLAVMSGGIDVALNVLGVDNEEQMLKLSELGCTRMQGGYFAPPMPAAALREWFSLHPAAE